MTDPYRDCSLCGRLRSQCRCNQKPPKGQSSSTLELMADYVNLRRDCEALEEMIASGTLEDEEVKRLDKAVTVMKVGFKMVKKVIRARGVAGRLKAPVEEEPA